MELDSSLRVILFRRAAERPHTHLYFFFLLHEISWWTWTPPHSPSVRLSHRRAARFSSKMPRCGLCSYEGYSNTETLAVKRYLHSLHSSCAWTTAKSAGGFQSRARRRPSWIIPAASEAWWAPRIWVTARDRLSRAVKGSQWYLTCNTQQMELVTQLNKYICCP